MVLAGKPFFGDDIRRMGEVLDRAAPSQQLGKIEHTGMLMHYVERLLQDYVPGKALNVVWDAGNGAAGEAMQELTERLPGTHTLLFADIDGTFPNHHPDPTVPKNLVDLQKAVAEKGADLGIAFDGDGDRIGIIDGQGRILFGDQILALMAEDMLKDIPGATIIADVKASKVLFDEIAAYGGQPLMWRTGHSLIKTKMAETKAPLAGEMSGHIFYADKYYGFDDALYAAVRFLSIVARSEVSLAERFDALPKMVNTPEMRIDCDDERKFTVIDEVRARLLGVQGIDVDATDGVRVTSENGWWLLRASNTQAVLVARCEAESEAKLAILQNELQNQLKESGVAA
jgi:phosphomannomutase